MKRLLQWTLVASFIGWPNLAGAQQPDLIFINSQPRYCTNGGAGSYSCADLPSGSSDYWYGVAVGDLNGDSRPDVVITNVAFANSLCLNDGNWSFACGDFGSGSKSSTNAAIEDMDNDGDLDVVFAKANTENELCLNDGSASFSCDVVSADTNTTYGVAVGDLDGILGPDLVFANSHDRNRVCLNDGSASFSCSDVSTEEWYSQDIAVGDLDGANGPDLVFSNYDSLPPITDPGMSVCLNNGAGSFACSDDTSIVATTGVALADLDGTDGLDAVFSKKSWFSAACLNNGTGSFSCHDVGSAEVDKHNSNDVALADINGDGHIDAVFANKREESDHACLNDGTGVFTCGAVGSEDTGSAAVATISPWNFSDGFESGDATRWSSTVP